jgi:hypothetical protein
VVRPPKEKGEIYASQESCEESCEEGWRLEEGCQEEITEGAVCSEASTGAFTLGQTAKGVGDHPSFIGREVWR